MNIGICTTDFETMPMDELFQKIHSMGFSSIQLAFETVAECGFETTGACEIPNGIPGPVAGQIAACAAKYGLRIVCVNGTFNMAHPDKDVREASFARFPAFIEAVRAVGCDMVTLCTGTRNAGYLWAAHEDNTSDDAWADMEGMVKRAVAVAEAAGITLLIETEASNVVCSPERARKLMDDVGSDYLKMVMDGANLFHVGEAYPDQVQRVLGHAFDAFGGDIKLAHGKDIKQGPGLDFCGAGDGIIDFDYMLMRLKALDYQGDMVLHGIKSEDDMPGALAFMRDKIMGA